MALCKYYRQCENWFGIPETYNPADFMAEIAAADYGQEPIKKLVELLPAEALKIRPTCPQRLRKA